MPNNVYIAADHMITSLGFSTSENMKGLYDQQSGLELQEKPDRFDHPFMAGLVDRETFEARWNQVFDTSSTLPFLEQLALFSVHSTLTSSKVDFKGSKFGVIVTSTKGNINFLVEAAINQQSTIDKRVYLSNLGKTIQQFFGLANKPLTISNACISGTLGIIMGSRLIRSGYYDQVLVVGLDLVTPFTLNGFSVLKALSADRCQPFDMNRKGINLGEACGTILLTNAKTSLRILGGAISNDANHISGPSRTGDGLYQAIDYARKEAIENGLEGTVDFINAHGTATLYNDEMEAKAFSLAGLQDKPVNSLKGYWGHTLGAAGVIETIASYQGLKENKLIASKGFEKTGVSKPVNIIEETTSAPLKSCLKTSSGFGGCNAALIISEDE